MFPKIPKPLSSGATRHGHTLTNDSYAIVLHVRIYFILIYNLLNILSAFNFHRTVQKVLEI